MIGKNMKVGAAVFALSLGGGLLAGSVLGSPGATSAASKAAVAAAATDPSGSTATDNSAATDNSTDSSTQAPSNGETALTGDTATQVTAAAQAAVPDGTIDRVETDSDGVYEAHMTKADGTHVIVQVDANFNVTATIDEGRGGRGGGPGAGETPLTGDTATQVTAAAQAAIPDGTVLRVETDSDGSPYEAHVQKADGTQVVLKIDANFTVTATEDMPAGGPHGGPRDHQPPAAPADQSSTDSSATTAG